MYVKQDFLIRKFVEKILSNEFILNVCITRKLNNVGINLFFFKKISNFNSNQVLHNKISLFLKSSFNSNLLYLNFFNSDKVISAAFIADFISFKLEKRVPFRKVLKDSLIKIKQFFHLIKGFKIQISGRLNGAEIARTEWVREGSVPLHTLTASIDYCFLKAHLFL